MGDDIKSVVEDLESLLQLQRFYNYDKDYKIHKKRVKKLLKKMKKKLKKGGD